jgi:hypothetical protein
MPRVLVLMEYRRIRTRMTDGRLLQRKLCAFDAIGSAAFLPFSEYTPQAMPATAINPRPIQSGRIEDGVVRITRPASASVRPAHAVRCRPFASEDCKSNHGELNNAEEDQRAHRRTDSKIGE